VPSSCTRLRIMNEYSLFSSRRILLVSKYASFFSFSASSKLSQFHRSYEARFPYGFFLHFTFAQTVASLFYRSSNHLRYWHITPVLAIWNRYFVSSFKVTAAAALQLTWLHHGLLPRDFWFSPGWQQVRFVMKEVTLNQFLFPSISVFSLAVTIPPLLHNYLSLPCPPPPPRNQAAPSKCRGFIPDTAFDWSCVKGGSAHNIVIHQSYISI
jgi:hypothetical protein